MIVSECLAADVADSPQRMLLVADVILRCHSCQSPREWVSGALRRWPGSVVAATLAGDVGFIVGARGDTGTVVFLADVPPARAACMLPLCALAAYGCVMAGRRLVAVERITIGVGGGLLADLIGFPADLISLRRADILESR
jgi:hypothetical protein